MTEQEWLAITDPLFMLEFFRRTTDRKLRLFAVACCRRVWGLLTDKRSRRAVDAAEQFAEGLISEEEFEKARWSAVDAYSAYSDQDDDTPESLARVAAADAACSVCWDDFHPTDEEEAYGAARATCRCLLRAVAHTANDAAQQNSAQLALLRCIFRSPFRPVTIDPTLLTSNVVAIAQTIYDERTFDRLPILADALEDAGCDNADVLNHCRQPGVHVRGCWVVDLVLGKE
jgi:hypothetical protein